MSIDIKIHDTGNGGEAIATGDDLQTVQGLHNFAYLSMFGGNVSQQTPDSRQPGTENNDWWGNALIADPESKFSSQTEKALSLYPLNSDGRAKIEEAVNADIAWMKEFCTIETDVSITAADRLDITIKLTEMDTQQTSVYKFIWSGTKVDAGAPNYKQATQEGIGYWFIENNFVVQ